MCCHRLKLWLVLSDCEHYIQHRRNNWCFKLLITYLFISLLFFLELCGRCHYLTRSLCIVIIVGMVFLSVASLSFVGEHMFSRTQSMHVGIYGPLFVAPDIDCSNCMRMAIGYMHKPIPRQQKRPWWITRLALLSNWKRMLLWWCPFLTHPYLPFWVKQ